MNPARNAALKALIQFRRDKSWTDLYLKNSLSELSAEDAALATAITYGVLQNMARIDHYIASYSSMKLNKIMPQVLDVLRCGVYQILFMDRIPTFAAVNESVALAKKHGNPRAGAFVNAVLRKIAANKNDLPVVPNDDPVKYLSTMYSHPEWLVRRLINQFGEEQAEKIVAANNTEAPVYIRVNTIKTSVSAIEALFEEYGITSMRIDGADNCLLCHSDIPMHLMQSFKEGMFYIQDMASQLAVMLLDPKPGEALIDMCSAPGGKSLLAAQLLDNKGEIRAFDIHEHKIDIIRQNALKYGIDIIKADVSDSSVFDPLLADKADRIICDVPCSGLGIIRKKPDIRYKSQDSIASLPDTQYKILENAAGYLKPGGRLVYSTCTIIKEENTDIINRFLKEHPDFELSPFETPVTGSTPGYVTLLPNEHNCDGFFISVLDRKQ